jgi:hypothetical protein
MRSWLVGTPIGISDWLVFLGASASLLLQFQYRLGSLGVKLCDKGEELLFVEFHYKAAEDIQYSLARNSS